MLQDFAPLECERASEWPRVLAVHAACARVGPRARMILRAAAPRERRRPQRGGRSRKPILRRCRESPHTVGHRSETRRSAGYVSDLLSNARGMLWATGTPQSAACAFTECGVGRGNTALNEHSGDGRGRSCSLREAPWRWSRCVAAATGSVAREQRASTRPPPSALNPRPPTPPVHSKKFLP